MKFANRYLLIVALLVVALAAVACGGNTAGDIENAAEDVATMVAEEAPEVIEEIEEAVEEPAEEPVEEPVEEPAEEPVEEPAEEMAFEPRILEDPDCTGGSGSFSRIEALDQYTVEFERCAPDPAFLAKVAFTAFAIWPEEYLESTGGSGELLERPIGTGPYKIEAWNRGDSIIFSRNEITGATRRLPTRSSSAGARRALPAFWSCRPVRFTVSTTRRPMTSKRSPTIRTCSSSSARL
jgi:peptide/nickel transport system substrate-binding protein